MPIDFMHETATGSCLVQVFDKHAVLYLTRNVMISIIFSWPAIYNVCLVIV